MFSALGVDFGTNSVRALVVDAGTGEELGTAVVDYPSGHQGVLLDKGDHHLARQNPADYLVSLEKSVRAALAQAEQKPGFSASNVIGIGVDTTGSSPIPVDAGNVPLAHDPRWSQNLAAQCWLWKDHTSYAEAAEITLPSWRA
jgi:L-ribulokinase